jgi:hypothetical protein
MTWFKEMSLLLEYMHAHLLSVSLERKENMLRHQDVAQADMRRVEVCAVFMPQILVVSTCMTF